MSYFEWVQNTQNFIRDLDKVNKELKRLMLNAFNEIEKLKMDQNISYRMAAYQIALQRIVDALDARGHFP